MRLDIGIPAAKELAGPLAGDFFRDIHSITAAIIALTGVASAYLLVRQVPMANITASLTRFSEAMSSMLRHSRDKLFPDRGTNLGVILRKEIHGLLEH